MEQIYGFNVSKSFVSDITNKMLPSILEWQNRPRAHLLHHLDGLYLFQNTPR
ncbi:MAG: transposase [Saprospiraceae bacterium]|nr:transposase [Saprospiraceae bacterium]